ncbi:MAG: alanine racemase [Paracoccaceae bacterium]
MSSPILSIDLDAITDNWRALDGLSANQVETGAVVKANAYGLGVEQVARALAAAGVQQFFVAVATEGAALRKILGSGPTLNLFCGHLDGDTDLIRDHQMTPMLNSPEQLGRHLGLLPGHEFGVQLDTGMSRLGVQPSDWQEMRPTALAADPVLIMSHLACADEPGHPMNRQQLERFHDLTDGLTISRSLSATGGILLEAEYHFDLTRPGIGIYGGLPFADALQTVNLSVPVIQIRELQKGASVGYGNTWIAKEKTRVATIAVGYADGILRSLSSGAKLYHENTPCPLIGRVSMDLITVDITHLRDVPTSLDLLCAEQDVDQLATAAGTIGYEILTSLGPRYERRYKGHG